VFLYVCGIDGVNCAQLRNANNGGLRKAGTSGGMDVVLRARAVRPMGQTAARSNQAASGYGDGQAWVAPDSSPVLVNGGDARILSCDG